MLGSLVNSEWVSSQLTTDHRPTVAEEAKRVYDCRGYIGRTDGIGPLRVWASRGVPPGLALSRSLGDDVLKPFGVTDEAEVRERVLSPQDKVLVVGSDGLFECVGNDEVVRIVARHYMSKNATKACAELMLRARAHSYTGSTDDVSCIVCFLN